MHTNPSSVTRSSHSGLYRNLNDSASSLPSLTAVRSDDVSPTGTLTRETARRASDSFSRRFDGASGVQSQLLQALDLADSTTTDVPLSRRLTQAAAVPTLPVNNPPVASRPVVEPLQALGHFRQTALAGLTEALGLAKGSMPELNTDTLPLLSLELQRFASCHHVAAQLAAANPALAESLAPSVAALKTFLETLTPKELAKLENNAAEATAALKKLKNINAGLAKVIDTGTLPQDMLNWCSNSIDDVIHAHADGQAQRLAGRGLAQEAKAGINDLVDKAGQGTVESLTKMLLHGFGEKKSLAYLAGAMEYILLQPRMTRRLQGIVHKPDVKPSEAPKDNPAAPNAPSEPGTPGIPGEPAPIPASALNTPPASVTYHTDNSDHSDRSVSNDNSNRSVTNNFNVNITYSGTGNGPGNPGAIPMGFSAESPAMRDWARFDDTGVESATPFGTTTSRLIGDDGDRLERLEQTPASGISEDRDTSVSSDPSERSREHEESSATIRGESETLGHIGDPVDPLEPAELTSATGFDETGDQSAFRAEALITMNGGSSGITRGSNTVGPNMTDMAVGTENTGVELGSNTDLTMGVNGGVAAQSSYDPYVFTFFGKGEDPLGDAAVPNDEQDLVNLGSADSLDPFNLAPAEFAVQPAPKELTLAQQRSAEVERFETATFTVTSAPVVLAPLIQQQFSGAKFNQIAARLVELLKAQARQISCGKDFALERLLRGHFDQVFQVLERVNSSLDENSDPLAGYSDKDKDAFEHSYKIVEMVLGRLAPPDSTADTTLEEATRNSAYNTMVNRVTRELGKMPLPDHLQARSGTGNPSALERIWSMVEALVGDKTSGSLRASSRSLNHPHRAKEGGIIASELGATLRSASDYQQSSETLRRSASEPALSTPREVEGDWQRSQSAPNLTIVG